eukprot:CAMPEP_0177652570 /NCGR_PEP_ID=MMETSP0447-20121125/13208_1 /TAXON_ID=0 /ORGANISM="Stygamoeba regulata, Strain BSH-02190019" /LENGTH=444 /DNA_ID=CAMNT_0019155839 /DNA_START=41 /DNA_END=1375 /DNA_ORIENTATION=-
MGPGAAGGASLGPGGGYVGYGQGRGVVQGMAQGPALGGPVGLGPGRSTPLATHTPDGKELKFEMYPCARCGDNIVGKVMKACDNTYHPECFVCTVCQLPFPDGKFIDQDGKPYCERDWQECFLPRCANCKGIIIGKRMTAFGRYYHPEHFVCGGCGTDLCKQTNVKQADDEIYCNECVKGRLKRIDPGTTICARCKKPIYGGDEYILLKGQRIHPEHYKCQACGCDFVGGNCHEFQGELYCWEDYKKLIKDVCHACRKPIVGNGVTAMGRMYHPEHFVCAHCHKPFPNMQFREHGGQPYCEMHYGELFAEKCAKCNRPVVDQVIHQWGKYWHPEHFVCQACERILAHENFFEWEAKPMCGHCYHRLPGKLREKVEKRKKREEEKEKQREKEAEVERRKEQEAAIARMKQETAKRERAKMEAQAKAQARMTSEPLPGPKSKPRKL